MSKQLIHANGAQLPLWKAAAVTSSRSHHDVRRRSGWQNLIVILLLALVAAEVYRDYLAPLRGSLDECDGVDGDDHVERAYARRRAPSYTANPAYIVEAKNGAVATENVLCSEMGVDILKIGGNAVDAAVTATLCIGVVSMYS